MTDWARVMYQIAPRAKKSIVANLANHMDSAFQQGQLTNVQRQAHFLARAAVETDGFRTLKEYWGPTAAQKRYEGRKDLGNTQSGDGQRFMGRGIFQLTGRSNYARYAEKICIDLVTNPELASQGEASLKIALIYWNDHRLNPKADADDVLGVCKAINGGTNGLSDQKLYLARAKKALAESATAQGQSTQIAGLLDASAQGDDLPHPLSREQVRALQQRLQDLGYHVGGIDGRIGTLTTGAISSYQHDHDLPITGQFDAATAASIWETQDKRPISKARAEGEPDQSRISTDAKSIKAGSVLAGGGAALSVASDALGNAEIAKGAWERVSALFEPLSAAREALFAHPVILLLVASGALFYLAHRIHAARIEDHQSGKTL